MTIVLVMLKMCVVSGLGGCLFWSGGVASRKCARDVARFLPLGIFPCLVAALKSRAINRSALFLFLCIEYSLISSAMDWETIIGQLQQWTPNDTDEPDKWKRWTCLLTEYFNCYYGEWLVW